MIGKFSSRHYPRRGTALAVLAASFVISRLIYLACGIRFDDSPLDFYWQYIDPQLLRTDFRRSIFYLEQQAPGFNFFLGAILHLFRGPSGLAFQVIYLGLGFVLPIALFELMECMGADRRYALAITLFFAVSPATILYENLLFYEYPLMILFCVAALFLYRFAARGRFADGLIFFSAMVAVALIRSIFHLAWFLLIVLALVLARPRWRSRALLAAALPGFVLVSFYAKHLILYHTLVPGGTVYSGINASVTMAGPVPDESIDQMIAAGKITPVLRESIFHINDGFDSDPSQSVIARIVPVPPKTGIPVRDDCRKSTEAFNWNCAWAQAVAKQYLRDSLVVFHDHPGAYLESLQGNLRQFFLPTTKGWPFDGRHDDENQQSIWRPLAFYDFITTGVWPDRIESPWLACIALPLLLAYGLGRLVWSLRRSWRIGRLPSAATIVLAFMVGNIIFLSAITVLFSESDQNRYRTEISTYFAVLLALAVSKRIRYRRPKLSQAETETAPELSHA